jgi:hypothetical protein
MRAAPAPILIEKGIDIKKTPMCSQSVLKHANIFIYTTINHNQARVKESMLALLQECLFFQHHPRFLLHP